MTTLTQSPVALRNAAPTRHGEPAARSPNPAVRRRRVAGRVRLSADVAPARLVQDAGRVPEQSDVVASPEQLNFSNYTDAWSAVAVYLANSLIAVVPALVITIIFGTAAGFALEVMVWKGRNGTLLLFLVGILIPGQMILLPLFSAYFKLGLSSTLWPLIISYTATALPLTVFLMATYFRAIPREIFEASTLDGASILRSFVSIGFPMMKNAIFTIALVQFFFMFNDLLIALTFTTNDELRTIQVGLLNFTGQFGVVQYGPTFAAICISVLPIFVLYVFLNQSVMKGLAAGSVKG